MGLVQRRYDMSIFGYDWHYDRNHDGEIDFFEDYTRMDDLF